MSHENVEIVRRFVDHCDRTREFLGSWSTPAFVYVIDPPPGWRGRIEGMRKPRLRIYLNRDEALETAGLRE